MKMGIVGLPNVGKSTLFNAITNAGAECANYPFCTIEPNIGVVPVPDKRLDVLAKMYKKRGFEMVFLCYFMVKCRMHMVNCKTCYILVCLFVL